MQHSEMTIQEALRWASLFLEKGNREPRVGEILLMHELGVNKVQLISNLREIVPENKMTTYKAKINQHVKSGIPVQHLTGYETFLERTYHVNQHVLIPRPETEELVKVVPVTANILPQSPGEELANRQVVPGTPNENSPDPTIVDVGTGSGVIAISLFHEMKSATVIATDISEQALEVAKKNAAKHDAAITFFHGSYLEPLIEKKMKVDIIVSNPPYIAYEEKKTLADTVKNFDPVLALFAEENGLAAYQAIIQQAKQVLNPNGMLIFEIGMTQGEAVKSIIKEVFPQAKVEIIQDISGKDRIVSAKIIE